MLSVQVAQNVIEQKIQAIETCQKDIQQEIEVSYKGINDFIDKLFTSSDQHIVLTPQSTFNIKFKTLEIPSNLKIQENELIQEIRPIVKAIVQSEVQKKEVLLNQIYSQIELVQEKSNSYEEKLREYESIIQIKEEEIQQIQMRQQQQQIIAQGQFKQNLNSFQFSFMEAISIKQDNWCCAITINEDNSIVIAGCDNQIKVYELKSGKLNQIQILSEHSKRVFTLNFMKQSNHFVSGSEDNTIIIWQMNQNNLWTCQQILNGHSSYICCLLVNNNEDLIISGSQDKSIKFWDKQKGWLCKQIIYDHTNWVFSLSLNEQQDLLISCSEDSKILIIEQSQKDKKWKVVQKIKVDQFGYRLCFIDNYQFVFQPRANDQLHIYEINDNKQFVKAKQIQVQTRSNCCYCLFPQQYIKLKGILVNKNGDKINFIRKKLSGEFIVEQYIELGNCHLYGSLSDDGEYLITWDYSSKEIQIRKCNEK
ncbi:unnamed protein product [Paramecium sonneborni]|uniref:WD40-repeat-containing domain n=1 Tax=Paramecium sonneborni TaxID=65129 RepID=A0A8S1LVP5_9CILI|nr:unnamed protein product [Paramecium sonneborni]